MGRIPLLAVTTAFPKHLLTHPHICAHAHMCVHTHTHVLKNLNPHFLARIAELGSRGTVLMPQCVLHSRIQMASFHNAGNKPCLCGRLPMPKGWRPLQTCLFLLNSATSNLKRPCSAIVLRYLAASHLVIPCCGYQSWQTSWSWLSVDLSSNFRVL